MLTWLVYIPEMAANSLYSGVQRHPCTPQTSRTTLVMALCNRSSLNSLTRFQTHTWRNLRAVTALANQKMAKTRLMYSRKAAA